ncbi:aminotransferase class V-fold PLP-dependent enzyme [Granulosicoccus antarcticus]|uniref:cysteine desulfurase n=1 Tax=Granulosicoccus antarcticus IMCC3135 TaxID=1192854 RepID=A0A2Z2NXT6_9GAMM|nr:aminotransferase class V-fold PLP-dependent enzyme [Granulosicoccus antarcticus]ASJ76262.1 Cysteine desulfurase IscS [Granulosicoccus antarcticus IMCC3135]
MKDNAYFDNAATTWPKPEPVYQFMDSFFRSHGVNPGRSGSLLAVEAEQMITATRRMLARFFGYSGPANRVVFTLNGTDSLNMSIAGLVTAGDHVISTRLEHNAVLRTLNHLERDRQVQVTRVAPGADGYIDPAAIKSALRPNTRAIVFNHASNVIGTVQPLAEVAAIAQAAGVLLIVDAAQTAGVLPIAMDELGISVLTFPGHKGLFGPMGIGGMIVAESVDLPAQRFGGTGVDSLSSFQPDVYPHHLEAGTICLPGVAGLHAAQLWFRALGERLQKGETILPGEEVMSAHKVSATGNSPVHAGLCQLAIRHIHQVELTHLERIEACLREHKNVRILANARHDARVATLSFTVDGMPTERIADQLDADHQICARAGLQCAPLVHVDADTVDGGGTIRLSPGYFTDEEDMQQLLDALDDILT